MAALEVYSTDQHLAAIDNEFFEYGQGAQRVNHRQARRDVERDLQERGFTELAYIVDNSASATVEVTFTNSTASPVTVPSGTSVKTSTDTGAVEFTTDEAVTVPAASSASVDCTASHWGEPWNVPVGAIDTVSVSGLTVTNAEDAAGGVDHQLTNASAYRCLYRAFMDMSRDPMDRFAAKSKFYRKEYDDEMRLLMGAGLDVTDSGGNTLSTKDFGKVRLDRC